MELLSPTRTMRVRASAVNYSQCHPAPDNTEMLGEEDPFGGRVRVRVVMELRHLMFLQPPSTTASVFVDNLVFYDTARPKTWSEQLRNG